MSQEKLALHKRPSKRFHLYPIYIYLIWNNKKYENTNRVKSARRRDIGTKQLQGTPVDLKTDTAFLRSGIRDVACVASRSSFAHSQLVHTCVCICITYCPGPMVPPLLHFARIHRSFWDSYIVCAEVDHILAFLLTVSIQQ